MIVLNQFLLIVRLDLHEIGEFKRKQEIFNLFFLLLNWERVTSSFYQVTIISQTLVILLKFIYFFT